jgi:hypothetical protein
LREPFLSILFKLSTYLKQSEEIKMESILKAVLVVVVTEVAKVIVDEIKKN